MRKVIAVVALAAGLWLGGMLIAADSQPIEVERQNYQQAGKSHHLYPQPHRPHFWGRGFRTQWRCAGLRSRIHLESYSAHYECPAPGD